MATGDQNDITARILATLPPWFSTTTGTIGALIQGGAASLALVYELLTYAAQQTRIKTATGGWLDMISADFFGGGLLRVSGQPDSSFRARILIAMFRERGTRLALSKMLVDLTGRTPKIFEPARPMDAGAYGAAPAVSRPSPASFIDDAGQLQTYGPNVPRYVGGQMLVEPQKQNLIHNNSDLSAVVLGAPGTTQNLSTWGGANGLTQTLVGKGVENGIPYVDLRWNGVATANWTAYLPDWSLVGLQGGSTYTASLYCTLQAGSMNNITQLGQVLRFNTSGGSQDFRADFVPTAGALKNNRKSGTWVSPAGATGPGQHIFIINVVVGAAIDITLRIALPQVEQGSLSSPILTTGDMVTRAADTPLANMPTGSAGAGGYGQAGGYGSLTHACQLFVVAYRPLAGGVSDADIFAAVDAVSPAGTVVWVRILD